MRFFQIFTATVLAAFVAHGEILPAEKLLPSDTLFMVTAPDFSKVKDAYQNSPHGRLWNDPAMKDFKDKFLAKLSSDYLIPLEHDLGVHFSDYTNLPQGQMTFAIVQSGWQGKADQTPAFLFLMDAKDQSAKLKTNLIELKKKWVDSGKTIKTEKIRDVDFAVAMFSGNEMPKAIQKPKASADPNAVEPFDVPDAKNGPKVQLYVGQVESLLIIGNSPAAIEKVVARLSGGEVKTISDNSSFADNLGMFRDTLGFGWANTKAAVDIYNHAHDADDSEPASPLLPSPKKIISALGLNSLGAVAFNYIYSSEGQQVNVKLAAPEGSRSGLFKMLAGDGKDCTPPPFVPADVVKFQRWRLDIPKTWESLRKIANELSPSALSLVDGLISQAEMTSKEKDPDFSFKKNIVGNFGDDIITYQKNPRDTSLAELSSPPSIYLTGSPNAEKLASSFKNIMGVSSSTEGEPKDREFLGHKIYAMPLTPVPGSDTYRSFMYTSGNGYLAGSTDTPIIEEFLRRAETPEKPLRELSGLSEASQKISGLGTSLFGFSNEGETMRVMLDILKKDPSAKDPLARLAPLALAAGMGDVKMKEWLDVTLLPNYSQISKYFYFSIYTLSANADGIMIRRFSPTPPGLKK